MFVIQLFSLNFQLKSCDSIQSVIFTIPQVIYVAIDILYARFAK